MASISIRGVTKSFGGVTALSSISLDIADGEFLALVGPSGSGKTTLLRIIAGLEEQTAGEISIDGKRVDHLRPKDRDIAMVFQSYALYPHMTVFDNIALPLRMRWLSRFQRLPLIGRLGGGRSRKESEISEMVQQAARTLDIEHLLDRKPAQLSGGQRQRVALGRSIVRHPKVFLMDEPLSNLDAKLRVQMRSELTQLHRRLKATFVYVTHDQVEAMTMANRVAVMMDGDLLQIAEPQVLYDAPQHRKVAEFIGSPKINILPGRVIDDGSVDALDVVLPFRSRLKTSTEVLLGIRPEALRPALNSSNGWTGHVIHIERLGSEVFLYVQTAAHREALIARLDPHRDRLPELGERITLTTLLERIRVFDAAGTHVPERLFLHSKTAHA